MGTINITNARKKLYSIVQNVNITHEPLLITSKNGSAVMVSQEDWRAIEETLYLSSIPDVKTSIVKGLKEKAVKVMRMWTHYE